MIKVRGVELLTQIL